LPKSFLFFCSTHKGVRQPRTIGNSFYFPGYTQPVSFHQKVLSTIP
jgi:hypothetical protein